MILKERKTPYVLLILEALSRRLPRFHPKYQQIQEELGRRKAGYYGEVALDYYLRLLPSEKYMILHDLNLPDQGYNCQIDTLLLTSEFALIIEVKNLAGKLIFDTDNEQLTQFNNEKEKGFNYPIAQAERHRDYLGKLMAKQKFPSLPIEYLVVISNGNSSYVVNGKNSYRVKPRVCKADVFNNRMKYFEDMYSAPLLDQKELRKLSSILIQMNTIPTNYILDKYGIKKNEILKGIFCPDCNYLHLVREKKGWYCSSCKKYSKVAHFNTLKDYFLLIDTKITNNQFRDFVLLKSHDTAKRILLSANLEFSGSKKGRVYYPKSFPW